MVYVFDVYWFALSAIDTFSIGYRSLCNFSQWHGIGSFTYLLTKLYGMVSRTQIKPSTRLKSMFNGAVRETSSKFGIFYAPIIFRRNIKPIQQVVLLTKQ